MDDYSEVELLKEYVEKYSDKFCDMTRHLMKRIMQSEIEDDGAAGAGEWLTSVIPKASGLNIEKLLQSQTGFMEKQLKLWQNTAKSIFGGKVEDVIEPSRGDGRFKDDDWKNNPLFSYIKQAYLLNAELLENTVDCIQFTDEKAAERAKFFTRQYISSMSPTNSLFTNPEVCREIIRTKGDSLAKGIDNFIRDFEESPLEAFKVTQVLPDAYELGVSLANTPGSVVYRNDLMELIQYTPTTPNTYTKPLLIVPAIINKFYIMDLGTEKSLVRWLVSQGFTVFMMSWINPDESHRDVGVDDYILRGILPAVDVVLDITKQESVNVAGYCIGGTLLAMTQAYLTAKDDHRIASTTFFASMFDFSQPGEVGNYVSKEMVPIIQQYTHAKGFFDGRLLGMSFSLLKENNLFWAFFINNYLKGQDPTPFDLLFWNSDSTHVPQKTYMYLMVNLYVENNLVKPGVLNVDGVNIDLGAVTAPSYTVAAYSDHIVPWTAAYRNTQNLSGDRRFILGGSGHIAGIINPAEASKYPHWVNDQLPAEAEAWLDGAVETEGSWWTDWRDWLIVRSGEEIKARKPGSRKYKVLEAAPGTYVMRHLGIIGLTE